MYGYLPQDDLEEFGGYLEVFGSSGGGGGGGGADAGAIIGAFNDTAKTVGGLIELGFKTEYAPDRRLKLIQDVLPSYVNGIADMGRAARRAKSMGDRALERKIKTSRAMLHPSILFGIPMPINLQADDSLAMEIYSDMINKANKNAPNGKPLSGDGGNIRTTRTTSQTLFAEALLWSLLPEAVAVPAGLTAAKNSAEATVSFVFGKPGGLALIYGTNSETRKNRVPKHLRQRLINRFIEWRNLGWLSDNQPLPPWLFGFSVDGKDIDPAVSPSIGAYIAITDAIGSGLLTAAGVRKLS